MHSAESFLAARCRAFAPNVRKKSTTILGRAGFRDQLPPKDDYQTLCEASVFLAFVELGGDATAPWTFDWTSHHNEVLRQSVRSVLRDLSHRIEDRDTFARRMHVVVEQFRWDAWVSLEHTTTTGAVRVVPLVEPPQEQELVADTLRGLAALLEEALPPIDWTLLQRHYLDGISQIDLTRELIAAEPTRYAGDRGFRAAKAKIGMGIMRARQRAQAALGDVWAEMAATL